MFIEAFTFPEASRKKSLKLPRQSDDLGKAFPDVPTQNYMPIMMFLEFQIGKKQKFYYKHY
jgi:hypothetical protein